MLTVVGFKDPPPHTRFKAGSSGNPRGRPRTRTLLEDLAAELAESITVHIGTGKSQMSKQRAVARALVNAAIAGDIRAATTLLTLAKPSSQEAEQASSDDEILADFINRKYEGGNDHTSGHSPNETPDQKENS